MVEKYWQNAEQKAEKSLLFLVKKDIVNNPLQTPKDESKVFLEKEETFLLGRRFSLKFPKNERLKNQKIIQKLFKEGESKFLYPFKTFYLYHPSPIYTAPQVLFSVSRRNFKKATDRNWSKRRMREAYRLNKLKLRNSAGQYLVAYIAFVYIAKEKQAFSKQETKIIQLLNRFSK